MQNNKEDNLSESNQGRQLHALDVYKEDLTGAYAWLRDNDYIYRGYRASLTIWESIKSVFRSHNETMNIWTHFLGTMIFIFFLYLTYAIPVNKYATVQHVQSKVAGIDDLITEEVLEMKNGLNTGVARWPITVFVLCAIFCLWGSTMFHTFLSVTSRLRSFLQVIDYCGICILISGSYFPVIYYTFYCYPDYLKFHLIAVIIINVLNVSVMATPTFRQPKYRAVRATSFTIVACYAFIALIHIYSLDGFNNPIFTVMFWYVVGMGSTYILGAILYGTRFPEKYFPGYFDFVFSSHQLFHVCIVIAALFHYVGSIQIFISRLNTPCLVK